MQKYTVTARFRFKFAKPVDPPANMSEATERYDFTIDLADNAAERPG